MKTEARCILSRTVAISVAAAFVFAVVFPVWAQNEPIYPVYVGTTTPVQDEFGANLRGDYSTALDQRDRVEIHLSTNSVVYPPDYSGNPDPRNPIVPNGVATVGSGTSPGLDNPGVFGLVIRDYRTMGGQTLFLRVFNAPTLEQASFYADSAVFDLYSGTRTFDVTFGPMQPIDPSDNDTDGLNNSWEKSYGTNPDLADTDGDGMGDWQEARAGTDALNPDSAFIMAWVTAGENNDAVVAWDSIPGKRYQVEYSADDLKDNPVYYNVSDVITATDAITETVIADGFLSETGHYRVRLVED